jgi:DnaJ homologue, subfamily C, member 28, conserved domain
VAFSRIAENRIREAMASGEFENLAGAGEPLNLEEYFGTPGDLRIGYSILKAANCVPAEVGLLNEISRLEQATGQTTDPDAKRCLQQTLANRRLELAVALERGARRRK